MDMEKGYVKLGLVLCGLALAFKTVACTPAGITEEDTGGEDTITAVKEDASKLSGEYVFSSEDESGVLKVFGPTPSEEIVFSLAMTTSNGCMIDRTGRAQLTGANRAVYYQVNTNCKLEFIFDGQQQVQVVQYNCPERDTMQCSFDGTYVLSMK
jgi:hypothetical protein